MFGQCRGEVSCALGRMTLASGEWHGDGKGGGGGHPIAYSETCLQEMSKESGLFGGFLP